MLRVLPKPHRNTSLTLKTGSLIRHPIYDHFFQAKKNPKSEFAFRVFVLFISDKYWKAFKMPSSIIHSLAGTTRMRTTLLRVTIHPRNKTV